jgi:hypothetical protein
MTQRSYLTEPEWQAVFAHFGVKPEAPALAYRDVSNTQLSIARHYGGCTVNGASYYYYPDTDELIRHDVFRWVEKRRADAVIEQRQGEEHAAKLAQGTMF